MISEEQDGTKQKLCRIWTNSALGAGARMRKIAVVTLFTSDPFTDSLPRKTGSGDDGGDDGGDGGVGRLIAARIWIPTVMIRGATLGGTRPPAL